MSRGINDIEGNLEKLNREEGNLRGVVNAKADFLTIEAEEFEEKRRSFIRVILGWVIKKAEIREFEGKK